MWHHLAGQIERCDECRFDGSAYTVDDEPCANTTSRSFASAPPLNVPASQPSAASLSRDHLHAAAQPSRRVP